MSGLLHLVEAATALTQLYPSADYSAPSSMSTNFNTSLQQVMSTAASTTIPAYTVTTSAHQSRRASTHNISDADDDMDTSCAPKIQDHLQALRAAAVAAGLDTQQPAAPPNNNNVSPTPESLSTSLASSRAFYSSIAETNKETFPMRLHAILADTSISDVVSWLPHGKAFVVLNPDVFTTQVLPRYISDGSASKSSTTPKYPSFTRKLNRWGFKQVSRGGDAGAFSHDLFQRDYPELCRSMVCQKSRKAKNKIPLNGSVQSEDMMSVSSASTKSVSLGEKRPYSSTVTVSTAGGHTSSSSSSSKVRNLPLKKRKSHKHLNGDGIPSMITHRNQKMPASTTSNMESDLTSGSESGSVYCSSNNNVVPKSTELKNSATLSAEASAAREALARHFHEQHRAFALATLMENSRLAMEAAGMKNAQASNQVAAPATPPQREQKSSSQGSPTVGAITTYSPMVFAPTVSVAEDTKMPANKMTPQEDDTNERAFSAAEAAKTELYSAFLQALASNGMTVKSS